MQEKSWRGFVELCAVFRERRVEGYEGTSLTFLSLNKGHMIVVTVSGNARARLQSPSRLVPAWLIALLLGDIHHYTISKIPRWIFPRNQPWLERSNLAKYGQVRKTTYVYDI